MPIVELEEYTFLIDSIVKKNSQTNSNCFYQFKKKINNDEIHNTF
jgi:hypothetical protein